MQEFPNIAPSNERKIKDRAVVSVFYTAIQQPQQCLEILQISENKELFQTSEVNR